MLCSSSSCCGGPVMAILLCLLIRSGSLALARLILPISAWSPSNPPDSWIMIRFAPAPAPEASPKYHGSVSNPSVLKHRQSIPHAFSPSSFSMPQVQDCNGISCSDPLTLTPIGSPCGCVYPINVVIDLGVAPFWLFTRIPELEVEVASGTFLKQSQVKIMGADVSGRDQERTRVTIYLVPLGEKFDNMTALLIYERFWQKKMPINMSLFGDYEVVYVHYPGLPSCPPSASGGSLGCGSNGPRSQQDPLTANVSNGRSQKTDPRVIVVIGTSTFILILLCSGVVFTILKCKRLGRPPTALGSAITPSITRRPGIKHLMPSSLASSISLSYVSTVAACPPSVKTFSLSELKKGTNGFSSKKVLGEGGFGRVYHGIMEDGSDVAIKVLTREDHDKDREFIAEVEMLSRLHHRNLVKLIGICIEGRTRCLVYELVRNGSVESHLHGVHKKKGPLNWDARMKIALGAARGLAYLHEDSNPRVIHRDFKASNILLEEDFNPKVSDFGLAREATEGSHHISTRVMGTFGYVAPEYAMTGHLIVKSDVYSYGVVLLELLSGRKPVYVSQPHGPENLVTWSRPLLTSREGLAQLIDPSLGGTYNFDNVARVAAIASMCVHVDASQRPFMGEVVQALKLIYSGLDETCEDFCPDSEYKGDCPESSWWNRSMHSMDYSLDLAEDLERPRSMSSLMGTTTGSGPLRTKTQRADFHRLRGTVSEHGQPSRPLCTNDF